MRPFINHLLHSKLFVTVDLFNQTTMPTVQTSFLVTILLRNLKSHLRGRRFADNESLNTRTAEKKKSRTAEEGKFTLYLYIRFYTR